jgi:limonene-1,2-epoxide hydrolase
MGAKQEAVVVDMLKAWGDGTSLPDIDAIVSAFAPEASWTLYMPDGPTILGREAIRAEVERQLTYVGSMKCRVPLIASDDNLVIAERVDEFTRLGRPIVQFLAGVFELDAENRIFAWRDYFDMLDLAAQAGVEVGTLSGLETKSDTATLTHQPPVPEAKPGGALSMALQPPHTAEQQLVEDFCDAWGDGSDASRPDVDQIVNMLAEDAEWQLWSPGGPTIRGRDALRAEILRQMQYATNNKCNTIHAVSNSRVVMQERSDWAVLVGRPCPHQMIAVYELNEDGSISRWREYINMADLDRKRGVNANVAHIDHGATDRGEALHARDGADD